MTVAELWFGALESADAARGRAVVDAFLAPFAWLPFDDAAADRYATARYDLEARGTPIGERDLMTSTSASAASARAAMNRRMRAASATSRTRERARS